MSYDNSTSTPSSSTRVREAGANEKKDQQPESQQVNAQKPSCDQSDVTRHEQGNSAGGGSSSPAAGSGSGSLSGDQRGTNSDDTDGLSSGNDSGERDSEGGMKRGSASCGHQSTRSSHSHSSSNGKDSGVMLETTESNKSSNFQSLSPPNSSLAYSLLSNSSEHDPPSTSGWSSDQSARLQTQKELMKAIKELKVRLPPERKAKGHSSTLSALKYALQCVRQVRANREYYHQWSVEECHGCSLDLSTFTIEELDNITSEYTLKNTDTFSMAVSFLSGRVVYVSPQCSSLLRCKPECLQGTMFSELLAPQDVSTFYSGTAPCRLPHWASCIGSASPVDCTQEKSMFCRISADRAQGGEMRYYPFRLTPYQLTLRDSDAAEPQPCCLLIAERVHSGYEAPRIPPDKRIFTTSHTPSCLFQEVDERAVPLLGYLPQDLVGTPILLYIHPEDRPMMVAIHEKIFQFAGQPFDYSPLRMCARNGEYLTIDTSWSSFVNPWSRKVAFVVGRHKVRTSPLNEDVFTPPMGCESRVTTPDIVQLSERIHRLLVQPVHSGGSQGYSSLGSSGSLGSRRSHQQHLSASAASSSDSNGPAVEEAVATVSAHKPMTFQQICKDVHMVKTNGQQVFIESRNRPPPRKNTNTGAAGIRTINSDPIKSLIADLTQPPKALVPAPLAQKEPSTGYSYQQINCLDSIIRYLESCNIPNTVKRKCGSSSCTASSTSDDDKQPDASGNGKGGSVNLVGEPPPLPPLTMASKAESVASVTSQCSFSSTIVHVGDKKPPESDIIMEDAPTTPTLAPPPATTPTPPTATLTPLTCAPAPPANTAFTPSSLPPPPPPPPPPQAQASQSERDSWRSGGGGGASRLGLTKEVLSAHTQQEEQAFLERFKDLSKLRVLDQTTSSTVHCPTPAALSRGVRCSRDYPAAGGSTGHRRGRGGKRLKHQESSDQHSSLGLNGNRQDPRATAVPVSLGGPLGAPTNSSSWPSVGSQASIPSAPFAPGMLPIYPVYPPLAQPLPVPVPVHDPSRFPPTQMVPPMMALVLPNYMFPQMGAPISQPGQFYNPNFNYFGIPPVPVPSVSNPVPVPGTCAPSRSSTPQSFTQTPADRDGAESPLFQSRCSSPLNLLQLEEPPSSRLEVAAALVTSQQAPPSAQGGATGGQNPANQRSSDGTSKEAENAEAIESNQDAMSTSSDLLDLLLQEDSRSGTGSAASGSGSSGTRSSGSGSGSNGCSSSGTSGTNIIMEDAPTTPTLAPPPATTPTPPTATLTPLTCAPAPPANTAFTPSSLPPPPPPPPPPQAQASQSERDSWRSGGGGGASRLGLTKEVLSAHTQQEEQAFLERFKDLSKLRVLDQTTSSTVHCPTPAALSRGVRCSRDYPAAGGSTGHRRGRGGKRLKHQESSDQHSSLGLNGNRQDPRATAVPVSLGGPLGAPTNSSSWPSVGSQASIPSAPFAPGMLPIYPVYPPLAQPLPVPVPVHDPSRFPPTQMVPPMMALVLPNYMFPQMGAPISQPGQFYNPNFNYFGIPPVPVPSVSNPVPVPGTCAPSRSSTPQSFTQTPADRDGAESPLFQSRCSSPLNLLQLEEPPSSRLEVAAALVTSQQAPPSAQGGATGGQNPANQRSSDGTSKEAENAEAIESNQDAMSTSSDLLDLLLQEDSRSGTGSAASGSGSSGTRSSGSGSGSNGCSSSGTSGTSSSQGSHTSKYFGSIDSSENDHSRKQPAGGSSGGGDGGEEQFIKCVLQDPIWLLMANTDNKVMMTYQLPVRDMETVLQKDREALRSLQKHQPRFTDDQKKELSQVHPWIRTGRLPRAINISGCAGCKCPPSVPPATPFDVEIHEMELCTVLKAQEEGAGPAERNLPETAMDDVRPEDEDEEEEEDEEVQVRKQETQEDGGDARAEKQSEISETVEEKTET